MCGILGCWGDGAVELVQPMLDTLRHRGPDGQGVYVSPDRRVALGHRRLAILDLKTGSQPLSNEDGTVWVTFNGEIYNYRHLRKDLEARGHRFRTASDTEVLVHAYEQFGEDFVSVLNGEFAFAIHDQREGVCLLARDRLGIRPVFHAQVAGRFYFASEIKALLRCPALKAEPDPTALDQYLALRYSFGEQTIIKGIRRLPPGCLLSLNERGFEIRRFWEPPVQERPWRLDEACDRLDLLLGESVRMRLMSDVPLGMYLSGGLDSALILALMAKENPDPVKTFSIGFGLGIDETDHARDLARRFRADHTEIRLPRDSFRDLPEIVRMMDEPLGDIIIVPTYYLSKEAGRQVKVVLTGEGADEIFGAYVHHYVLSRYDRYRRLCPKPLRRLNRAIIGLAPVPVLDRFFPYPESVGRRGKHRLLDFLGEADGGTGYLRLVQVFDPAQRECLYSRDWRSQQRTQWQDSFLEDSARTPDIQPILNRLIALDTRFWLPDYTLFKQDRLTMANSVEGRVPYLDHRLVEFAGSLPVKLKQNGVHVKYLLRRVARRHLPEAVAARKKAAFYLPVPEFFGPEFHDFVRDTLSPSRVRQDGYFDPGSIQELIEAGLKDELLESKRLMAVLIFTIWSRSYVSAN